MITASKHLVVDNLSKGLNTFDPPSRVAKGHYVDAQNMVLTHKTPITIGGLTRINITACPSNETIVWFEPYTTASAAHSSFLVATSAGKLYYYTPLTEDTAESWTPVLKGLSTAADDQFWAHVPFRGTLFIANGTDRPMKWDGTNILPIGARLVADMESDETWIGTTVVKDTTDARVLEGSMSLQITSPNTATRTLAAATNFTTALNGGTAFGASDYICIRGYREAGQPVGTFTLRFRVDASNYATSPTYTINTDGWAEFSDLRSTYTNTGSMDWTAVTDIQVIIASGGTYRFDWWYFRYAISPPQTTRFIEMYNQQLICAGRTDDLIRIDYSNAGTPDEIPAVNFARFSGGVHALEKADQITALKSYYDELIVGKVNSAWTFSGTGTNVSISALPLTIGIDSHRAVAETPWSLHYPFEHNIFGARLTSRGLVSTNISGIMDNVDADEVKQTVAIRGDKSHTVRWSFLSSGATVEGQNNLGLIYDYQLDAWASRFTPNVGYYTRGIIDNKRDILCSTYGSFMYQCDTGTTFDGTPIVSYVTLPYLQTEVPDMMGNVVRWVDWTVYLRGAADVNVDARFADEPHEFDTVAFTTFGTVKATPDGDKGYGYFGITSRWVQLRLRATAGAFEILVPILIGYNDTARRV